MWPNPQETAALVTFTEEILKISVFVQWKQKKTGYINFDVQYIFNIILSDITTS